MSPPRRAAARATPAPVALTAPLHGVQRIEASAGTGKTWTLGGLVLRLVVERGLPIETILAVTFTRAATAELRERIRARLQGFVQYIDGALADDAFAAAVLARCIERDGAVAGTANARRRAETAVRCFDEAPIFTIHGFCQRVLAGTTVACGLRYGLEFTEDVVGVRRQRVEDWWRREIVGNASAMPAAAHAALVEWLIARKQSPDTLDALLVQTLKYKDALIRRPAQPAPGDATPRAAAALAVLVAQWPAWRDSLRTMLSSPVFKQNIYSPARAEKQIAELDDYVRANSLVLDPPPALGACLAAKIAGSLKKGATAPTHPICAPAQELAEALAALHDELGHRWLQLRLRLVEELPQQLRDALGELRLQSYDDMLVNLRDALAGPQGTALARQLRGEYRAVLVDEFQDTDPVQYEIFRRLQIDRLDGADEGEDAAATLFVIGDPKQAIYAFRGADVFAYLRAAQASPHSHALAENQRSVAPLVAAVNRLFASAPRPFLVDGIGYTAVQASPRDKPVLRDHGAVDAQALRLLLVPGRSDGNPCSKAEADDWVARATAAEIARLLRGGAGGEVGLDARAIRGGDIAVLVDAHARGQLVREALAALGIGCAVQSTDSVFFSPEAEQLERLLLAIDEPHRESLVRAALATGLLGASASDLLAWQDEDSTEWEQRLEHFRALRERWSQRGFMPMFRQLLVADHVTERLSGYADGARRLTNLFHLAELLHQQATRLPGIEAQVQWFARQRREQPREETLLRLESDENLVQIVTIHVSKGLEYPVTFVPFAYRGRSFVRSGDAVVAFHDPQDEHRVVLDLGSPDRAGAVTLAREEELAESVRLLYVALTRAKNRCYVGYGYVSEFSKSALGWLLHASADGRGVSAPASEAELHAQLEALAATSAGAIARVEPPPPAPGPAPAADGAAPVARTLARRVPSPTAYASFTSLQAGAVAGFADAADAATEAPDAPDHDQGREPAPPEAVAALPPSGSRFGFPRGAAAGECLHEILEHIDFAAPAREWTPVIARALARAGYELAYVDELRDWLDEGLRTPLPAAAGGTLRLRDLPAAALLREVEFHLPLTDADFSRLPAIARRHGVAVADLAPGSLQGFLKGFIDLVFQHDGRTYIVDYKSNWLGQQAADYAGEPLEQAMRRGGYHLQYLLYTVAIVRLLRRRDPRFDYARDFGGTRYLFLRGMHPDWHGDGVASGVHSTLPPAALIDEIDALLKPGLVQRLAAETGP